MQRKSERLDYGRSTKQPRRDSTADCGRAWNQGRHAPRMDRRGNNASQGSPIYPPRSQCQPSTLVVLRPRTTLPVRVGRRRNAGPRSIVALGTPGDDQIELSEVLGSGSQSPTFQITINGTVYGLAPNRTIHRGPRGTGRHHRDERSSGAANTSIGHALRDAGHDNAWMRQQSVAVARLSLPVPPRGAA